jgi:hypothetical protein
MSTPRRISKHTNGRGRFFDIPVSPSAAERAELCVARFQCGHVNNYSPHRDTARFIPCEAITDAGRVAPDQTVGRFPAS